MGNLYCFQKLFKMNYKSMHLITLAMWISVRNGDILIPYKWLSIDLYAISIWKPYNSQFQVKILHIYSTPYKHRKMYINRNMQVHQSLIPNMSHFRCSFVHSESLLCMRNVLYCGFNIIEYVHTHFRTLIVNTL